MRECMCEFRATRNCTSEREEMIDDKRKKIFSLVRGRFLILDSFCVIFSKRLVVLDFKSQHGPRGTRQLPRWSVRTTHWTVVAVKQCFKSRHTSSSLIFYALSVSVAYTHVQSLTQPIRSWNRSGGGCNCFIHCSPPRLDEANLSQLPAHKQTVWI